MTDTIQLPTPAERPDADIVLYDGQCNFCRAGVNNLVWWDCCNHLAYLSIHDPEVAQRWPDLPFERLMREMCIVDREEHRHWGADAVRYLSRRLRRLWWLAPLLHIPFTMPLWRWLYGLVARNRYRIAGKRVECDGGTCHLHR